MGVYINMEMPTTGLYFVSVDNTGGRDKTVVTVERMLGNRDVRQIVGSFELVPVPPHGDLVDRREAIIDANERAYDFWLSDDEVNATIQFLKEQPTIIPEEGET